MIPLKRVIILFCLFLVFSSNTTLIFSIEASYFRTTRYSHESIVEKKSLSRPELFILSQRLILYEKPHSPPPELGYPVLFLLHGASQYPFSWFFPFNSWSIQQSRFSEKAIDAGFFIVAPSSGRPINPGPHAWSSFIDDVNESEDLKLFNTLFNWLENDVYFPIDLDHVFCAGFSSGGFMTSRLAKEFPDRFSGVLVHSGTDADSITFTSSGPEFDCNSPLNYSKDHPPTLVVHGEKDRLVPYECGLHFFEELQRHNITSSLLTDTDKGHIWLSLQSEDMLQWFESLL